MNSSVEVIKRIESGEPIPYDSVDFTINNPERVRESLGATFHYIGRVENEVALNLNQFKVMLPRMDETNARFLNVWAPEELRHGEIIDTIQRGIGLTPAPIDTESISMQYRIAGALTRLPGMHDAMMLVYASFGAMHERMANRAYKRLIARLEDLGETALARTAIAPILPQEARHELFYKTDALERKAHMNPRAVTAARYIIKRAYHPVGATTAAQQAEFGSILPQLTDEPAEKYTRHSQQIAEALFDGKLPDDMVIRAVDSCIALSRQAA